jgi:hypothetical protein
MPMTTTSRYRPNAAAVALALILLATNTVTFRADGKDSAAGNAGGVAPPGSTGPCRSGVGTKDDTIGGRTGPPGSKMENNRMTGTPDIATNPPCGPK